MTSSKRFGTFRDPNRHEYKEFDPFCEPSLVSILFLSCGKPQLTGACFRSLVNSTRAYTGEIEWIFYEGGGCKENFALFSDFECERKKIIVDHDNAGINCGFNDMHRIARGEFHVEMESDWFNQNPSFDWITMSLDIFASDKDVSLIQLRSIYDPNENFGLHKAAHNVWSVGGYGEAKTAAGHSYLYASDFYGYSHNPQITRKKALHEIIPLDEPVFASNPRHGETVAQEKVKHWKVAHIHKRLFEHVGGHLRPKYEAFAE